MKRARSLDPNDRYYSLQLRRILKRAHDAKLDAAEFGAFHFLIDRMWIEDGPVEDDPHAHAAALRVPLRTWNKLVRSLVAQGLLTRGDGFISDAHTYDSIMANRAWRGSLSAGGKKGVDSRERNRALQREKDARRAAQVRDGIGKGAKGVIRSPQQSATPAAVSREMEAGSNENNVLSQAQHHAGHQGERDAISKYEFNSERVELEPAREGMDDAAFAAASAQFRQRWEEARARGETSPQGALKLGPVVVASNDAPVMDASAPSRASDGHEAEFGDHDQTSLANKAAS